ncbi:glutathione binding-like protein, partial [Salmonella enterica]|uniref:glutathione binding-like protein n=1 Tax=Salmonella enterica TaxID=28901 RepID=UPI00398C71B5
PSGINHTQVEPHRLYNVWNRRLEASPWRGGDHCSIGDIATWPWVNAHKRQRIDIDTYPAVYNWFERSRTRPATARALLQAQLHGNSPKAVSYTHLNLPTN